MSLSSRVVRLFVLLTAFLVVASPAAVFAQPAWSERQISGVVRDSRTHEPLPGVTAVVADRVVVTDQDGRFTLRAPAGPARVELSLGGFYTLTAVIEAAVPPPRPPTT